jgi:hydroxylamine reductase
MSMFCYQCEETAGGKGCTTCGVCGKTEEVARLQDLLIYTLKGVSEIVDKGKLDAKNLGDTNYEMLSSLFMTITNANFDDGAIEKQITKMIAIRDELRKSVNVEKLHDSATFTVNSRASMLEKAAFVGVLTTENEDVRSLREMITYGLKGLAAYTEHAKNMGNINLEINTFIYEALAATLDDSLTADDLVALTLKTGQYVEIRKS